MKAKDKIERMVDEKINSLNGHPLDITFLVIVMSVVFEVLMLFLSGFLSGFILRGTIEKHKRK